MGERKPKKQPAPVAEDKIDSTLAAFAAKRDFITYSLNMGWQLALVILVPVFIGVQLDSRFDSRPAYTLAALFLAIGGSVLVVSKTIKEAKDKYGGSSG